jgi:hypothetical protein
MPSAAFSSFNGAGGFLATVGAQLAAGGAATLLTAAAPGPAYGAWAGPGILPAHLTYVVNRWNCDRSEDNRRVYVDAVLHAVLSGGGMPAALVVTCQESVAPIPGGGQMGHGYLDYLLSALFIGGIVPRWNPSVIIEAKLNLAQGGAANDYGQEQLISEMVTARQLAIAAAAGAVSNYQRGVLTDGRNWRFYELDAPNATIRRSRPYDITVAADYPRLLRLFRKFLKKWDDNTGWLV